VPAFKNADVVLIARPQQDWGVDELAKKLTIPAKVYDNTETLIQGVIAEVNSHDHIIVMSNTGFDGLHEKLLKALK
jgi:UDP-N-acetylmuramate: L-alanyl-gamma-D-glutamyl-meso-diaminopimelate ligase